MRLSESEGVNLMTGSFSVFFFIAKSAAVCSDETSQR